MSGRLFVFRVDASVAVGTGHMIRCLTLAEALKRDGEECVFLSKEEKGNLNDFVRGKGFRCVSVPADKGEMEDAAASKALVLALEKKPSWVVVDHYSLGLAWESVVRPGCDKIFVIDDLANRAHDCDLLLDQNYYENADVRYEGKIPARSKTLLGPSYCLLRPEFISAGEKIRDRVGKIERVLIFMGGSDPTGETQKALRALSAEGGISLDVVAGSSNPAVADIAALVKSISQATLHVQTPHMAQLIAAADLAVAAGGSSSWERCVLGLPSLVVLTADNQREMSAALAKKGAIERLGFYDQVTEAKIQAAFQSLKGNPGKLEKMSQASIEIMQSISGDGLQFTPAVIRALSGA